DVQRHALVDRVAAVLAVAQVARTGRTLVEVARSHALGVQQLDAADDLARAAVDDAGGVEDRVGGHGEALAVDAALNVADLDLAVGVADVPVDVVDEEQAVTRTAQAHD